MLKKIVITVPILVLVIFLSYFSFQYFYLGPVKNGTEIEFNKEEKEIIVSLSRPIPENYFLKNFEVVPKLEGKFVFDEKLDPPFHLLGYKEVHFKSQEIEIGKTYKVKNFNQEFSFSLPAPQPKELSFSECNLQSDICQEEGGIISITFFEPIEEKYFFKNLKVYKCGNQKCETVLKDIREYSFSDSNKRVIIKINPIEKDRDYRTEILGKELSFKIESPKTKSIFFSKARQEITITFTKPIEKEYFLKNFKSTPYLQGKFIFDESGTKIVFKPYKIQEGKVYRIEVLGRSLQIGKRSKTLIPQTPQLTSKDKLIEIDLSGQRLWLHQEGKIIGEYIISSGKPGMPTPTGTFKVLSKIRLVWSAHYRLYMPYSLNFYNGYFIHELPYWPGGYREGENHLGIPVSHGCVRLGIGTAVKVYNFATIGTKVVIHK